MIPPSQSFRLSAAFFYPLLDVSVPPHIIRTCHGIEDASGCAFLDAHHCPITRTPARSSFFDALASPRRLQHLKAIKTKPWPASYPAPWMIPSPASAN